MSYKILWLGGLGGALVAAIAMVLRFKLKPVGDGLGAVELCKLRVN